jgi:hypothetical protein
MESKVLTLYEAVQLISEKAPKDLIDCLLANYLGGRNFLKGEPVDTDMERRLSSGFRFGFQKDYCCYPVKPHHIPVLQECASFLRDKDYPVFFLAETDRLSHAKALYCVFVVGECARVLDKIYSLDNYFLSLLDFIHKHQYKLPLKLYSEKCRIEFFFSLNWDFYAKLIRAYTYGAKGFLKDYCEKAWKYLDEVEDYLESIIDLRRLHAISSTL